MHSLFFRLGTYTTRVLTKPIVNTVMKGVEKKVIREMEIEGYRSRTVKFFKYWGEQVRKTQKFNLQKRPFFSKTSHLNYFRAKEVPCSSID